MSTPQASHGSVVANGRRRRTLLVVLVAAALVLVGGGAAVLAMTGDEPGGTDGPGRQRAGGAAAGGVAVPTRVVRLAGELHPAAERRFVREVRVLVEEYVEDAYVGKGRAFPGFTDRARRIARRDADVTTGRRLGGEVTLRSGRVRVSVLAQRPRSPVGATAAMRLELAADGARSTVTGQLLLTPSARGWRVFGYDLAVSGPRGRVDATTEDGGTER